MPNASTPFGLKIVKNQSGVITRAPERIIVAAASATAANIPAIAAGDPVYIDGNGYVQKALTGAAGGNNIIGTFAGVEYSDSSGKRTVSNWWSTPAVYDGSEVWFWFTAASGPDTIFEIQTYGGVNGNTGTNIITQSIIGNTFNIVNPAGVFNKTTGFSVACLDTSGWTAGGTGAANGLLIVYGLAYDPTLNLTYTPGTPAASGINNWSDPFVNLYVKLAKPEFAGAPAAF